MMPTLNFLRVMRATAQSSVSEKWHLLCRSMSKQNLGEQHPCEPFPASLFPAARSSQAAEQAGRICRQPAAPQRADHGSLDDPLLAPSGRVPFCAGLLRGRVGAAALEGAGVSRGGVPPRWSRNSEDRPRLEVAMTVEGKTQTTKRKEARVNRRPGLRDPLDALRPGGGCRDGHLSHALLRLHQGSAPVRLIIRGF